MSKPAELPVYSELYSAYVSGTLTPAFALLVETQAALRQDIRQALDMGESFAAVQLEKAEPAALSEGELETVFNRIDALETEPAVPAKAARQAGAALEELLSLPEPLRDTALESAGEQGWSYTGPGLRRMRLNIPGGAEAELHRIEPGISVPRHTHEATEFTLVIQGGFTDETGSFGPGDLAVKGPDDTHTPVGDEDGVCIVLAVRDGGLKFTGMLGMIQRFLG